MTAKRALGAVLAGFLLAASVDARAVPVLEDSLTKQVAQDRFSFDAAAFPKGGGSSDVEAPEGAGEPTSLLRSAPGKKNDSKTAVPAPARGEKPESRFERFEERLFKISFWAYHVSWAADTFMTGWGISHGYGVEADKLYTKFGNKNVLGVVSSLAAGHAAVTAAALFLDKKGKKRHGWKRHLLLGAAIGMCAFGTVEHVLGAKSWGPLFK